MSGTGEGPPRYPLAMRLLHWIRAALLLGLVALGWYMNRLPDSDAQKFGGLFPLHKELGLLTLLIVVVSLTIRSISRVPREPLGLKRWEVVLSAVTHRVLYTLAILVPLMGYAMSSSFTQSDGVPFFGFAVPELLPKNDAAFAVFETLHHVLAYALLGVAALHVLGALKHRFFDADPDNDVMKRML